MLISAILSGYEVVSVDNANDGLRLALAGGFSLYLLDYNLPGVTGHELCRTIRAFDPETPALFITASCTLDESKIAEVGAQGLITKGSVHFFDELVNQVSKILPIFPTVTS